MARINNPFQAQTPIGASIASLGNAIFGNIQTPGDAEKQRLESQFLRARIGDLEANTRETNAGNEGVQRLADIIGRAQSARTATVAPVADPGVAGPARAVASNLATETRQRGIADLLNVLPQLAFENARQASTGPERLASIRGIAANVPGFDDQVLNRARIGAATGAPSLAEARGTAFRGLSPEQQLLSVGPSQSQVRGRASQDVIGAAEPGGTPVTRAQELVGLGAQAFGSPTEGVADPTSSTGIRNVVRADVPGTEGIARGARSQQDITGVPAATRNRAQQTLANVGGAREINNFLRELSDPSFFGSAGFLKQTVQNAREQGAAFSQTLGGIGIDLQAQITGNNAGLSEEDALDPELFDANLPQFQFIKNLLVYRLALINNPDGRISTPDFLNAQRALGAKIGVFSLDNEKQFLANLNAFDRFLDIEERINSSLLAGDFAGAARARGGLPAKDLVGPRRPRAPGGDATPGVTDDDIRRLLAE